MDNLTINMAQSPSFTGVQKLGNLSKLEKVANHISAELHKVNPNDKKGRTFVKMAEDNGLDIFLHPNKTNNGVRIDMAPDDILKSGGRFDSSTYVNIYKNAEEFSPSDVHNKLDINKKESKKERLTIATLAAAAIVWLGGIGLIATKSTGGCTRHSNIPQKPVPAALVNDSIKKSDIFMKEPVIKDTANVIRKVIK